MNFKRSICFAGVLTLALLFETGNAVTIDGLAMPGTEIRISNDALSSVLNAADANLIAPTIIGGIPVTNRALFPYMARLICTTTGGASYLCGASLISNKHVLTAAHCITDSSTANGLGLVQSCSVTLGDLSYTTPNELGEQMYVVQQARIKRHPSYNPNSITYDIAILGLPTTLPLNTPQIKKINLPAANANFQGQAATIVGWGVTGTGSISLAALMTASTVVRTDTDCGLYWNCAARNTYYYSSATQACYSGLNVNGICSGDSGGPVVSGSGTTATIIALNSFVRPSTAQGGYLCSITGRRRRSVVNNSNCRIDTPAVGTKVSAFLSWISTTMAQLP